MRTFGGSRQQHPVRRRAGGAAVVAALVTTLVTTAGCTAGAPDDDAVPPSSSVVQPGRPGEPTTTLGAEDLAERQDDAAQDPGYAQADVDYMTQMIHHHLQALEMSGLAPDRASDPQVAAIADRIDDVQGAEVHALVGWLEQHDLPVPVDAEALEGDGQGPRAASGHDHGGADMPGMLSEAQLAALEAADGTEFDRLFVQGMIQHHQGAVDMSVTVLEEGSDERVNELAADIGAGQEAEISRLKDILASLS